MIDHELDRASFRPIVGIDLGTTNSSVAYIKNGQACIISSSIGEHIIPSVVLIDPSGKVIVGEDARASLVAMPDRTIAAVKRKMGSTERITLGGEDLLPHEISAFILKELKSYVDNLYGEGEKEAVITVPAYFTDEQRKATKEAGELAGFVVERIINEPTAAALAFGLDHLEEDRIMLVYDLGGGTFDVSIVEMMSGLLEVKASTGNRLLGGEDFDWLLVDWLAQIMITEHAIDPREDIRAKATLKQEAEKVKKTLSEELVALVSLPLVAVKNNQPIGLSTAVTRDDFVNLIKDMLAETMESVQSVLNEAGISVADVDDILLVGGSTRIPHIHQLISDLFGKAPRTDINPDEAVALGAAVQAGLKSGALSESGLVATDVAPFSMGIAVIKETNKFKQKPGGFAPIIPRNTTIPVKRSQKFHTSVPGQTAVAIEIYQGEHEWVKHNYRIGEFMLEGIPENWEELEEIEVTFRYNLNGILEVTAKCMSTDKEMNVNVQDGLDRNSINSFLESAERLESLWAGSQENELDENEEDQWEKADWDRMDAFLEDDSNLIGDDDDDDDEDENFVGFEEDLQDEIMSLRVQALKLADSTDDPAIKARAQLIIDKLDKAAQNEDIDQMKQSIADATDDLIDLEV